MSTPDLCAQKKHDITDFSKCTEHPFTTIVKIIECASKTGDLYEVIVPTGTIPFNILMEYVAKYNVKFDVEEKGRNTVFKFSK